MDVVAGPVGCDSRGWMGVWPGWPGTGSPTVQSLDGSLVLRDFDVQQITKQRSE